MKNILSGETETGTWNIKNNKLNLDNSGYTVSFTPIEAKKLLMGYTIRGYELCKSVPRMYSGPSNNEYLIQTDEEMHYVPKTVLNNFARIAQLD